MFAHRQLDGLLIESMLQTNHQIQGTEAHSCVYKKAPLQEPYINGQYMESPFLSFL